MRRLPLDVAEQQGVDGAGAGGQDEARVVGDRARGDAPDRAPHDGVELTDPQPVPGVEDDHGYAA